MPIPPTTLQNLRSERRTAPLGIDAPHPRLSWQLASKQNYIRQSAYEIRVGDGPNTANLWDSGKTPSDEITDIPYLGKPLRSNEKIYWKVRIWDNEDRPTSWSQPATWTTGILHPNDWQARWIGSADPKPPETLLLRRTFSVKPGLLRAIVNATGMGQYEFSLNGRKVGDDLLTPGWTNYRKTVLYDTYDVTNELKEGLNAAGIFLGNGMDNVHPGRYTKFVGAFGPQRALAQLKLTYRDGVTETVATDQTWQAHPGPITFSSVYGGEDYDYRIEPEYWNLPGFNQHWQPAKLMQDPGGELRGTAHAAPPIRAFETLKPRSITHLKPGVQVVDLGQNTSVMIVMRVDGPAGSQIRVIPAELLKANGEVDRSSVGGGLAYWQVTLAGKPATYFSNFFYQGCRYLQVETTKGSAGHEPKLEAIEGVVIHSAAPETGEFACSSDLFNRIHTLIRWAQLSNMVSVLTDCPHRERLGWLEQYHLNGPSLRYEHDLANLFAKATRDMQDSQLPNGLVPDIAPEYTVFDGPFRDSPEWGSSCVLVPWQQYQFHRDTNLLRQSYDMMKRYVAYLRSTAKDCIVSHGLGDWYDIGPGGPGFAKNTPIPLTATAFYYQDAKIVSQVAALLGKTQDAQAFAKESDQIREALNRTYFDPAKGQYATGSQTANAMPLVMGIAPEPDRATILANLVKDIQNRGYSITAGDVGYRYVLRALADGGRSDVIFAMNNNADKPGYAYQLKIGATSLTEAWDADRHSSQNHFMLGQLMEWFYHDLAGIQPSDGFKHFILKPASIAELNWVKASYRSDYGLIKSSWRRKGKSVTYTFTIPPNSDATIELPGRAPITKGSGTYIFS